MVKKTWFYMQNKMKNEKEKLSKMKMKNVNHRNLIAMTFKYDKYVAAYICIRPSQYLWLGFLVPSVQN